MHAAGRSSISIMNYPSIQKLMELLLNNVHNLFKLKFLGSYSSVNSQMLLLFSAQFTNPIPPNITINESPMS